MDIVFSASVYNTDGPNLDRHPNYTDSYMDNVLSLMGKAGNENLTVGFTYLDRPGGSGIFSNTPGFYYDKGITNRYGYENREGTTDGHLMTDFNGESPTNWHLLTQQQYIKGQFDYNDDLNISAKLFARQTSIPFDSYLYAYVEPIKDDAGTVIYRIKSLGCLMDMNHQ